MDNKSITTPEEPSSSLAAPPNLPDEKPKAVGVLMSTGWHSNHQKIADDIAFRNAGICDCAMCLSGDE